MCRHRCRDCGTHLWMLVVQDDVWILCPTCDGAALATAKAARGLA